MSQRIGFVVLQFVPHYRLSWIHPVVLAGSALLVDSALAQDLGNYNSGAKLTPPVVAAPAHPVVSQNGGFPPPTMFPGPPGSPSQQSTLGSAATNATLAATPRWTAERTSLDMIAPQAQAHIDYALNLAERGAVQSAQAEFIMALKLIAEALDADTGNTTRAHARSLLAGLRAIEETKDFVPADTPHDFEINLAPLAAIHQTPVLKDVDTLRVTRAEALQRYHTYATQHLAFAGGRSTIASNALYGLGRAESVTAAGGSTRNPLGAPNAMALFQAALLVDPNNYMASNELGVFMARFGDLDGAATQFVHSLSIKPQAETWHNLATVYRRMGQSERAEQAEQEREKLIAELRGSGAAIDNYTQLRSRPALQWVDEETFAASSTPYGLDGPPVNANKSTPVAQREPISKRLFSKIIPWSKPDQQERDREMVRQTTEPSRGSEADGWTLFR